MRSNRIVSGMFFLGMGFLMTVQLLGQEESDMYSLMLLRFDEGEGEITKNEGTIANALMYEPNTKMPGSWGEPYANGHGVIKGASWTEGKFGKALKFNGDDYVQIPSITFFGDLTLSCRIKLQESKAQSIVGDGFFGLGRSSDNKVSFGLQIVRKQPLTGGKLTDADYKYIGVKTTPLKLDEWYQATAVYRTDIGIAIFLDGKLCQVEYFPKDFVASRPRLHRWENHCKLGAGFTGLLDEFHLSEIARLASPLDRGTRLPRVLLLGDSICGGYGSHVQKLLEGKAEVYLGRLSPTQTTPWLEVPYFFTPGETYEPGTGWDVIHFNSGLHDLKYGLPTEDKRQVPIKDYEKNLKTFVNRMRAWNPDAGFIWASTTPVPAGASGRLPEDPPRYNEVAAKVMAELKIPINDLYRKVSQDLEKYQLPSDVHFRPEGYDFLTKEVAAAIEKALEKRAAKVKSEQ